MLIILDLDYTLLNTRKFKKGLARSLGLSMKKFNESYKKLFTDNSLPYDPRKHINETGRTCEASALVEKVNVFLKTIDKYLFPEAEKILKEFKNRGYRLILLTYGNLKWQERKIENSKIKKYFDKFIFTDKAKEDEIKFLKNNDEEIIIVNDNARECAEIKKFLGKGKVFLIRGPYSDNVKHNFRKHSLTDLRKLG